MPVPAWPAALGSAPGVGLPRRTGLPDARVEPGEQVHGTVFEVELLGQQDPCARIALTVQHNLCERGVKGVGLLVDDWKHPEGAARRRGREDAAVEVEQCDLRAHALWCVVARCVNAVHCVPSTILWLPPETECPELFRKHFHKR